MPGLIESIRSLRALKKFQELTLEIHESLISNSGNLARLQDGLMELNVDLAFDDFGAGEARLVELVDVHPKYVKFDISLIRGIHEASQHRHRFVASVVQTVRDLGAISLAEGVECEAEANTCAELGFQLAQGFFFGRPAPLTNQF